MLSFKTRYTSHEASTNPIEGKQKTILNKKNILRDEIRKYAIKRIQKIAIKRIRTKLNIKIN